MVEAYGVIGMLDRIREPRVDIAEPSPRGVAGGTFPAFEGVDGVSSTRRRNCELFIIYERIKRGVQYD